MAFSWFKKKQDAPQGPDFSAIDSAEKAQAAYRRGDMVEKRRAMMAAWAGFLSGAEAQGNVVRLGV